MFYLDVSPSFLSLEQKGERLRRVDPRVSPVRWDIPNIQGAMSREMISMRDAVPSGCSAQLSPTRSSSNLVSVPVRY